MKVVRVYTGPDGYSHFEDVTAAHAGAARQEQKATGLVFRTVENGSFQDWHNAPRRQYVLILRGGMEIGISDATLERFDAGDVLLTDDLTGRGHTTRAVGDGPRISCSIPLD